MTATTSMTGQRAFSCRVASMPSMPGISRSISTTSGSVAGRFQDRDPVECLLAVAGLPGHGDVVDQVQVGAHPGADDRMVIDQEHA